MTLLKKGASSTLSVATQLVFLGVLAYAVHRSGFVHYREGASAGFDGQQMTPEQPSPAGHKPFGPIPGWELYDRPIAVFSGHFCFVLFLLGAAYVVLGVHAAWKRRWPEAGWWLLPVCVAVVLFFGLAYIARPTVLY